MVNSELIILGMIYSNPSHGYLLKKNVKYYFGNPYFKLNNNVLYSTLNKLEKKGYIKGNEITGEKLTKKVYHTTETGKKHLINLVSTPIKPETDDFGLKIQVAFFDIIPKKSRVEALTPLYESKLKMHKDAIEKMEKNASNMPAISLTVLEYGIKALENALEFYEKLMDMD